MYIVPLDEETATSVELCLMKKLKNVNILRKKILSGELRCCAVKPNLVIDPFQIIVAANKAVLSKKSGKLITKSLHSELLYNLSITKNISQSLSNFGVSDSNENVLIVVFHEKGENVSFNDIKTEIDGVECDLSELKTFSDVDLIKKTYRITDAELHVSTLTNSVISRIATKEFGSC